MLMLFLILVHYRFNIARRMIWKQSGAAPTPKVARIMSGCEFRLKDG